MIPYLNKITSPTLLLDRKICENNLKRMKLKADRLGLRLTPHFKTPQSLEVGHWARSMGIDEISVSSVKMAEYLSGSGWRSIHIAFPFNIREIDALNRLSAGNSISVQIVNPVTASKLAAQLQNGVSFFIEIDAGYGRTGVKSTDFETINVILEGASRSGKLIFKGFYIHPGHSYYTSVNEVYDETRDAMKSLKNRYLSLYPDLVIRAGDTPGCSVVEDFGVIDELGPGNFIFYDLMQVEIGSCNREDIAVALAAPVVDVNREEKKILVHGGGVHLSRDFITGKDGSRHFGEVVLLNENGWSIPEDRSVVEKISQEHGIIKASDELLNNIGIGDLVGILPVHSCMTADCMKGYLSIDGTWIDHAESSMTRPAAG